MYLEDEILPKFHQWVNSLSTPVTMKEAKKYAKFFIAKYIDPAKAGTRGAVYDLFEDVYEYAQMRKLLHAGQMDAMETLRTTNLHDLAYGIVWAMEHDGFDTVKYDPITQWGMDITTNSRDIPA